MKIRTLAKLLKLKTTKNRPDNGYCGYKNGERKIFIDPTDGKSYIVVTCRNCGDGSWISIPKDENLAIKQLNHE
jgi:hypothetical protein